MARLQDLEIRNKDIINNIRDVQIDLMLKINNIQSWKAEDKAKIIKMIESIKFYFNTSKSKTIGSMNPRTLIMRLTQKGINLNDKKQKDIIGHEICHLIANRYYDKNMGHSPEFKNICRMLGFGHIANATTSIKSDDFTVRNY